MQRQNLDENGAIPVVNFIGIILGFASLSTLLIVQSLTFLLPLLFAPMVCVTLLYVLYISNRNIPSDEETIYVNPVRVDILWGQTKEPLGLSTMPGQESYHQITCCNCVWVKVPVWSGLDLSVSLINYRFLAIRDCITRFRTWWGGILGVYRPLYFYCLSSLFDTLFCSKWR